MARLNSPERGCLASTSSKVALRKRSKSYRLTQQEKEEKHKNFLERNRVAAGKCRTRKKQRVESLEEKYNIAKHLNLGMREQVSEMEVSD